MTDDSQSVLPVFQAPDREASLHAVSRALLRIRSTGMTCDALAKVLGCSADTIKNASNEESLLSFDAIARLGFHFPEEFKLIETLWTSRPSDNPTTAERLDRIDRELAAIRRDVE